MITYQLFGRVAGSGSLISLAGRPGQYSSGRFTPAPRLPASQALMQLSCSSAEQIGRSPVGGPASVGVDCTTSLLTKRGDIELAEDEAAVAVVAVFELVAPDI